MKSFIEVTGQASLVEQVVEYRADLSLTVRAAQAETAINEAGTLRDECIRALKAAGLSPQEMSEGGREAWRPWFWKKKPGQEASYKILITCSESKRLYGALDALQPIFENQRYSLSVSMLSPRVEAAAGGRATAQASAIADARKKATVIAGEAGITLSSIVQVEELASATGRSGAYGDEDWRGVAMAAAAMPLTEDSTDFERLDGAKRSSAIRYRVRFAILA